MFMGAVIPSMWTRRRRGVKAMRLVAPHTFGPLEDLVETHELKLSSNPSITFTPVSTNSLPSGQIILQVDIHLSMRSKFCFNEHSLNCSCVPSRGRCVDVNHTVINDGQHKARRC